jgi:hypothetical protein
LSSSKQETTIATKAPENPRLPEGDRPPGVDGLIRRHVLAMLGRPDGLLRVAIYPLWNDHYRVNVLTGGEAASAVVTDSFFVVVDDAGVVVRSTPPIKRRYGVEAGAP